jgi:hypothetical protein
MSAGSQPSGSVRARPSRSVGKLHRRVARVGRGPCRRAQYGRSAMSDGVETAAEPGRPALPLSAAVTHGGERGQRLLRDLCWRREFISTRGARVLIWRGALALGMGFGWLQPRLSRRHRAPWLRHRPRQLQPPCLAGRLFRTAPPNAPRQEADQRLDASARSPVSSRCDSSRIIARTQLVIVASEPATRRPFRSGLCVTQALRPLRRGVAHPMTAHSRWSPRLLPIALRSRAPARIPRPSSRARVGCRS